MKSELHILMIKNLP